MASATTPSSSPPSSSRGEFERQRGELLREIAESFDQVLSNVNKLNRNLESVIAVGNEFSSVEALWSTFENVMGRSNDDDANEGARGRGGEEEEEAAAAGRGGDDVREEDGHEDSGRITQAGEGSGSERGTVD